MKTSFKVLIIFFFLLIFFSISLFFFWWFFSPPPPPEEYRITLPQLKVDLPEEEIEEMKKIIKTVEEEECQRYLSADFERFKKRVQKYFYPRLFSLLYFPEDVKEKWKQCLVTEIKIKGPYRFKLLPDRIVFIADAEIIYERPSEEPGIKSKGIIYYFKKDEKGKWKIEDLDYIDAVVLVESMIEDTLERLKNKEY